MYAAPVYSSNKNVQKLYSKVDYLKRLKSRIVYLLLREFIIVGR